MDAFDPVGPTQRRWTPKYFRVIVPVFMEPSAPMRRFPRARLQLRVEYKNFEGRTDLTRDVSLGGAFIQTSNPAPRGTVLGLYVDVPSAPAPFEVGAEVIWCKLAGQSAGMGVRFIYASEPHRWLLEDELKKLTPP